MIDNPRARLPAALLVAACSYVFYSSTLLPGQDLGDTAVFQVIAASGARPTARDAYPLYYALATQAARLQPNSPAGAVNRLSAVFGACAAGAFVWVAAELTASTAAAAIAALLFATSYTFWTQAIIAEVYTLHLLFVLASMGALMTWARRPSARALAAFFAIYALSFGNHLSMVLLFPAFAATMLIEARHHPGGVRSVLRPRAIALAVGCTAGAALQYASMLQGLTPSQFWHDVTKADWRETLVMGVRRDQVYDRIAMYLFELRQQFGWPAVIVAAFGAVVIVRQRPRTGLMLWLAYATTFLFAFTYNVGDSHVFFLSSHALVALWFAYGLARLRPGTTNVFAGLAAVYVVWRIFDAYPAVDRSQDHRPERFFAEMTEGLTSTKDVFVPELNWQQIDGLAFYSTITRPDVTWTPLDHVLPRFEQFVRDNHEIGRSIVLNRRARDRIVAAFGDRLAIERDPRVRRQRFAEYIAAIEQGTPYALTWIAPYPDTRIDPEEFDLAARALTRGRGDGKSELGRYVALVGKTGDPPSLQHSGDRPFRAATTIDEMDLLVRFDSWPAFDTIRRAGFGHVIAGRRDLLPIDRGISLSLFDAEGRVITVVYRGGILEPEDRFVIAPGRQPRATLN